MRRLLSSISLIAAVASCVPELAVAQSLSSLTRATGPELGDSTLLLAQIASPFRTRAVTVGLLKTVMAPSVLVTDTVRAVTFDSVRTTRLRADTISSKAGASKPLVLQTWTSGTVRKNTLVLGADTTATFIGDVILTNNSTKLRGSNATAALSFNGGVINFTNFNGTNALNFDGSTATFGVTARLSGSGPQFRGSGNHSASLPAFTDGNAIGAGMWVTGNSAADTVRIGTDSTETLRISGAAAASILGGAGNMSVQAGTGASRTMTLKTTNSSSAAISTLTLGADSSIALLSTGKFLLDGVGGNTYINNISGTDTIQMVVAGGQGPRITASSILMGGGGSVSNPGLRWNQSGQVYGLSITNSGSPDTISIVAQGAGLVRFVNNSATNTGDVNVCITTGNVIRKGATCGTSSLKAKTSFGPIADPVAKLMALRPTSYSYIPGIYDARHEYGLLAEQTAAVDPTLVFLAPDDSKLPNDQVVKKGEPLNVNDRAVLALLIATVQQQQRQIDSLRAMVRKP